jgi:hypothetical protein
LISKFDSGYENTEIIRFQINNFCETKMEGKTKLIFFLHLANQNRKIKRKDKHRIMPNQNPEQIAIDSIDKLYLPMGGLFRLLRKSILMRVLA